MSIFIWNLMDKNRLAKSALFVRHVRDEHDGQLNVMQTVVHSAAHTFANNCPLIHYVQSVHWVLFRLSPICPLCSMDSH